MQRLLKNWKIIAYFVGFFALAIAGAESVGIAYAVAGMAWLLFVSVKDGKAPAGKARHSLDEDVDGFGSTANGRWDPTHPMSPFNNSYFDHN